MTFIILFCIFECEICSILLLSRNFGEAQLRLCVKDERDKMMKNYFRVIATIMMMTMMMKKKKKSTPRKNVSLCYPDM